MATLKIDATSFAGDWMRAPTVSTNWRQVAIAATAQNAATGLAFGSFGTLVLAIEHEYHAGRSTSSLAISLMLVSLSVTASILGKLLEAISIRTVMLCGAVLSAAAFGLVSVVEQAWQLLAIYLLLLGPATAMLGVLPSMTLAARWSVERNRGIAMGVVNMPLLVMIVPLTIAPLLESEGIRVVYRVLAVADLLLIPLLLFVRNMPDAETGLSQPTTVSPGDAASAGGILRSPVFWTMVVVMGLITGAGTTKLAHFVPLLIGQGRTFGEANMLLALSGGAGLIGSFTFGALADRMGGARALLCNALIQAVMWSIFLAPVNMPVLIADAIVVGACGGGVQACAAVALTAFFGSSAFSKAFGLSSLFTLPFLFGLTPLTSLIFEATGNYHLAMSLLIGGFILSALLLVGLTRKERPRISATNGGIA